MSDFQFSIILISFNNFHYIFEALNSIFKQTYGNIQLIISDDASSDFCREKLEDFLQKHKPSNIKDIIINVNEQNLGTVLHLENLQSLCTGELITIIAADDAYYDSKAIERLAEEYIKNDKKIKIITSQLAMCGTSLKKIKKLFISKDDINMINSGDTQKLFEELSYRCIIPSSGTAIAPSVYEQIGKLYPDYHYIEDWSSHVRMARMGIKIKCLDHITVLHRDGGISHGNTRAEKEIYLKFYRDILTIYEKEVEPYDNLLSHEAKLHAKKFYEHRVKRHEQDKDELSEKIVFYFRKGVIAQGDFSLYYRIADYMVSNYNSNVYCINNSNKSLHEKYRNSSIKFCNLTKDNLSSFKNATFVVAFNQLFFLLEEIKELKDAKILLLFLHPQITDWMKHQMFSKKLYNFESVCKLLKEKDAYGFMDIGNKLNVEKIGNVQFEKRFFPVVYESQGQAPRITSDADSNNINIGWMGRLDTDKIYSILNFLDNIYESEDFSNITFHLIGDGNAKYLINPDKYAPKIRFVFNSYLFGEHRNAYIQDNLDLVIAMGISALDVAMLGIPTIIPLVSSVPFRDNKFVYLYDTVDYSLGSNRDDFGEIGSKTHTAEAVLSDIYLKGQKAVIGNKCFEFASQEFSVEKHIQTIMTLIESTNLTVADCLKFPSFSQQLRFFGAYKMFNKRRSYQSFVSLRDKLARFRKLPMGRKLRVAAKKVAKRFERV